MVGCTEIFLNLNIYITQPGYRVAHISLAKIKYTNKFNLTKISKCFSGAIKKYLYVYLCIFWQAFGQNCLKKKIGFTMGKEKRRKNMHYIQN